MRSFLVSLARRMPPGLLRRIGAWQWSSPLARRLVTASSNWLRRQDVVIAHGVAKGLRFNAAGANPAYALGISEPMVQEWIARMVKPRDVVYDIGANVGFFTVILARLVGHGGVVAAFEPLPASARAAQHNADLNGFTHVKILPRAVGRRAGTVKLELQQESTWARLATDGTPGPTVDVEMVAIDSLVADGTLAPPQVMKIDVEGAELEVMEGMRDTIVRHRPLILCEMHGKNAEFAALMETLGYDVRCLEGDQPLATAPWDVHAVATPRVRGA